MKRPVSRHKPPTPDANPSDANPSDANPSNARSIDIRYGLEPVLDLGSPGDDGSASGSLQFHTVQCPYCGESYDTQVDPTAGSASYVEDCQVCCQPIEFNLEVDSAGVFVGLVTLRSD
jgi:Cysteine-rich CPXCG